jgi:hypothetical protein
MSDNNQNQAAETRHHDLYGAIHRGLRKAEMEMLSRVGVLDANDDLGIALVIKDLRRLIVLARYYLVFENDIHASLRAHKSSLAVSLAGHADHDKSFAAIEYVLSTLEAVRGANRKTMLKTLYLRLSEFIARDFQHMLEEEMVVQPLLYGVFDDKKLAALEDRLINATPDEIVRNFIRIIVPALDPDDQEELIARMRRAMPPRSFETVMRDMVRPVVSDAVWKRLCEGDREAA